MTFFGFFTTTPPYKIFIAQVHRKEIDLLLLFFFFLLFLVVTLIDALLLLVVTLIVALAVALLVVVITLVVARPARPPFPQWIDRFSLSLSFSVSP